MSKSDPDSAIFMEDTVDDVKRKIKKAYCPPEIIELNPVVDYVRYIILPAFNNQFVITIGKGDQKEEVVYTSYEDFEKDYVSGRLHPSDLKPAVTDAINELLQPVRDHFAKDSYARNLLETIKRWQAESKK